MGTTANDPGIPLDPPPSLWRVFYCLFPMKQEFKKLYNSSAWKRLRAAQLAKHPLCKTHLELGRTVVANTVDHEKPHRGNEGLFFDADNLQSLCKPCHDAHKQRLEKTGTVVGCDAKGIPLDTRHHWR